MEFPVVAGLFHMCDLLLRQRRMLHLGHGQLGRGGFHPDTAWATVKTGGGLDPVDMGHIGDVVIAPQPSTAIKPRAEVATTVVDTTVKANAWPPIASIPGKRTSAPGVPAWAPA
jgi:hypothetical protein